MVLWRSLLLAVLISLVSDGVRAAPGVRDHHVERAEVDLEQELDVTSREGDVFLNEWAANIEGGKDVAAAVAREFGYNFLGQIGDLKDRYHLQKIDHPTRSKRDAAHHTRALDSDDRVIWAEQQRSLVRTKRDFLDKRQEAIAYRTVRHTDRDWDDQWYLRSQRRAKRETITAVDTNVAIETKAYKTVMSRYNDRLFSREWYLMEHSDTIYDKRIVGDKDMKADMGTIPVWYRNVTGKGVTVVVIDDGVERDHPDLAKNYSPEASFDFNGGDEDPMPRYDTLNSNRHGTRCAGEIAMEADNSVCGVGVAYHCKIGGIRILDGPVSDALEAKALTHAIQIVDIFTCSWGPRDNGQTVEGPGRLATEALERGVTEGRNGKGIIYVWASGNGGAKQDNCGCDGYAGSIYTVSINSVSDGRTAPWYTESCPSTMAATYSSGSINERKIVSTDIRKSCTTEHTGTSASAPLAAGIFALTLEACPDLTWRDIQHLVAWSSQYAQLRTQPGWKKNGAGYYVNHKFGFGLLNANEMYRACTNKDFKTVSEKYICEVESTETVDMSTGKSLELKIDTSGCNGQDNQVNYLEHVVVRVSMSYSRRGALAMSLTSPQGTTSKLLAPRSHDGSEKGFKDWPFMSVHYWGENPSGTWTLTITDQATNEHNGGQFEKVTLALHGMKERPSHVEKSPNHARVYTTDDDSNATNGSKKKKKKKGSKKKKKSKKQ